MPSPPQQTLPTAFQGALANLVALHDEEVEALQLQVSRLRSRLKHADAPLICHGIYCDRSEVQFAVPEPAVVPATTKVLSSGGNMDRLTSMDSADTGEGTNTDVPEDPNPRPPASAFRTAAGLGLRKPKEMRSVNQSTDLKERVISEEHEALTDDCPGSGKEAPAALAKGPRKSWHAIVDGESRELIQQQAESLQAEMEKIPLPVAVRMLRSTRSAGISSTAARWTTSWVVDHPLFDGLCALMIVVNSVIIGCSVQWLTQHHDENYSYIVAGHVCTAFFGVELLVRLHATGIRKFFINENRAWNIFDFLLVLLAAIDLAIQKSPWGSGMKMVKMLRIVRVFRVFRFFRALSLLALMIIDSLMSLGWAIVLVTIIIYVFGIWFTQKARDHIYENQLWTEGIPEVQRMFGGLHLTIYTLIQATLGGVSWGVVSDALLTISFDSALLFFFYIAFTILAVLNIVTGVFVDNAVETAQTQREFLTQKEMEIREKYIRQMRELFQEMDKDGNGTISIHELREYFQDTTMISYFKALGLDVDDTERLFYLIDDDSSGGIGIDEFLTGCLRLKGQARSIDIHALLHDIKKLLKRFDSFEDMVTKGRPARLLSSAARAEPRASVGLFPELVRRMSTLSTSRQARVV